MGLPSEVAKSSQAGKGSELLGIACMPSTSQMPCSMACCRVRGALCLLALGSRVACATRHDCAGPDPRMCCFLAARCMHVPHARPRAGASSRQLRISAWEGAQIARRNARRAWPGLSSPVRNAPLCSCACFCVSGTIFVPPVTTRVACICTTASPRPGCGARRGHHGPEAASGAAGRMAGAASWGFVDVPPASGVFAAA